jgi:hypothetical protein
MKFVGCCLQKLECNETSAFPNPTKLEISFRQIPVDSLQQVGLFNASVFPE